MPNFGYVKFIPKSFDGDTRNCGYCKTVSDDATHGMWAYQLTCQSYQDLIDRNWRRSGCYCYRPLNDKICCPMYTIRCHAKDFTLRKSQRKAIKNFNNFVKHGIKPKATSADDSGADSVDGCVQSSAKAKSKSPPQTSSSPAEVHSPKAPGTLKESKKKFGRRERYIAKIMKRSNCSKEEAKKALYDKAQARNKAKSLEELLDDYHCDTPKHRFRTELHLVNKKPTQEEYDFSYQVYKKYQISVHKDDELAFSQYRRFLLDSPLLHDDTGLGPRTPADFPKVYGSYNQRYYIDDVLIAVGVIDILPNCLSSVYLFYDPEYSFLNLGTYSALNEIATVRKLSRALPKLEYYYLGYYIDSCPKMRYKGKYSPSDLLCSEAFKWCPIKDCLAKLDGKKYSRFSPPDVKDENAETDDRSTVVIYDGSLKRLSEVCRKVSAEEMAPFRTFARLIGRDAIKETLYLFD